MKNLNRKNALDVASHIATGRKLKIKTVNILTDYISVCFYYLFEKERYNIFVEYERITKTWKYVNGIVDTDEFYQKVVNYLKEMTETNNQVDTAIREIARRPYKEV